VNKLDGLLRELRAKYPYAAPGAVFPATDQHIWLWNMALAEGREQVLRAIEEMNGGPAPYIPDPADDDVFSPQDRSPADTAARSGTGYGTPARGEGG